MILKNGMLVIINHIVKFNNKQEINLVVQQFLKSTSFFMKPIDSYKVDTTLLSNNFLVNLNEIKYKCISIEIAANEAIIISLHHSLYNK